MEWYLDEHLVQKRSLYSWTVGCYVEADANRNKTKRKKFIGLQSKKIRKNNLPFCVAFYFQNNRLSDDSG